jgi:2-iminobutanoate/2-iminopropanoate deaminase
MNTSFLTAAVKAAVLLSLAVPLVAAEKTAAGPQYFPMPSTGGAPLPFSEAVQAGDTLYVSGQVGILPGTMTLAAGGIGPEARQALDNLKAILERHGTSLEHVVKCTVFLADIKEWPAFNVIYREYFKTNLPARSALAASGLALGARVEVECIAIVPPAPPAATR